MTAKELTKLFFNFFLQIMVSPNKSLTMKTNCSRRNLTKNINGLNCYQQRKWQSYNENLEQSSHETLYGMTLKTVEIGPTSNQTTSVFAKKKKKKKANNKSKGDQN